MNNKNLNTALTEANSALKDDVFNLAQFKLTD